MSVGSYFVFSKCPADVVPAIVRHQRKDEVAARLVFRQPPVERQAGKRDIALLVGLMGLQKFRRRHPVGWPPRLDRPQK